MGRLSAMCSVAALVLALADGAPASGATYFVNQSAPGASDSGSCLAEQAPCRTIGAAVRKAAANAGNTVRVLPGPSGRTDVYAESVVNSGQPIALVGAGSGAGGTTIAPSSGFGIGSPGPMQVSDLRVVVTGNSSGFNMDSPDTRVDRVVVDAPDGTGYFQAGTVEDSLITARTGVTDGAGVRLVRTVVHASDIGVQAESTHTAILSSIVRSDGGTIGILAGGTTTGGETDLRHVTVTGFQTRVQVGSSATSRASLAAANCTFAASAGLDIELLGPMTSASLTSTDASPSRTSNPYGAALAREDPIDVPPDLTADGHLNAGSPLIDRGSAGGVLSGDPDDALDVDRERRPMGQAPDVGADEWSQHPSSNGPDTTPPKLSGVHVTRTARRSCPAGARRCRGGGSLRFRLSEPATVELVFRRRGRRTRRLHLAGEAGSNRVRFGVRSLPRGRYRLVLSALDAAGNRSVPVHRSLRVL